MNKADFILLKGNHNKASMNRTIWYSIDYTALEEKVKQSKGLSDAKCIYAKCTNGSRQNAKMELGKMHKAIPENTHKNTHKTTSKKEKVTNFDACILEHTQNKDLQAALRDFIKMRTSIKKPLTDRALKMVLTKLKTLAKNEECQIKLLEQSILYCWQDVYPLKDNNSRQSNTGQGLSKYGTPNYDEE